MSAESLTEWEKLRAELQVSENVHDPIPPQGYIRVLELNHGEGPITCQIYPILLEQVAGLYDALSYCWGDPKDATAILINGKSIPITTNLYNALLQIRRESGSKPRLLWADAICINQEDKKEKSHQVQMMGDVYQFARCVPVWLGLDNQETTKDCFDLMKETASACRNLLAIYGHPAQVPGPLPDNPICQDLERWGRTYALMNVKWFKRVWVKQEVGLAVQCSLMLGTESMQIQDLVEIILFAYERVDLFPPFHPELLSLRGSFYDLWGTYNNSPSWRDELSPWIYCGIGYFVKVLQQGRYFGATDPRDHVYAFLSHPTALNPNTHLPLIIADYEKDVLDIYYDTACAILKARPSDLTYLLSCVDRDQEAFDEPYPSWVPQWHLEGHTTTFGYPGECRDSPDSEFTLLDDRSLVLSGFIFDEIDWISSTITESDSDPPKTGSLSEKDPLPERIWKQILQHKLGSQYSERLLDAFFMTMVAAWRTNEDEMPQLRADFYAYCDTVNANIPRSTSDTRTSDIQNGNAATVARNIKWATRNRRFFSTKSGYFGVGRHLIQRGDVCCVFQGTRLPFVIRPITNISRYKFVGDAYIHGVSKGEILERQPLILEDIILQ
jgi:Heterokaryon incompatibility protein (HET)